MVREALKDRWIGPANNALFITALHAAFLPRQGDVNVNCLLFNPSSWPCLVFPESPRWVKNDAKGCHMVHFTVSQESTTASSTELPPFVSTGSKDPNLGILKWGLGWILSRMFWLHGGKLPPMLSRLNLPGHHFGIAHVSQMYPFSLLACTELWPKAWGGGRGQAALNMTDAEMLRDHGGRKLMFGSILLHSSHSTP